MTELLDRSAGARWFLVLGVTAVAYLLSARWYGVMTNDATAAAWPAWNLVHHGTVRLDGLELPRNNWWVETDGHVVSNRFPGVVLIGVPAQLLLLPFGTGPEAGATLTAASVTALAMANLGLLLHRLGGTPRQAVACTFAFAFGTAAWPVASAELLTHGPDLLWLSLAALALERGRWGPAAVAMAPLVLTRPHLGVVLATVGVTCSATRRSPRPALVLGAAGAVAVALLVTWNRWLYGAASLGGGYPDPVGRAQDFSAEAQHGGLLTQVAGTWLSPLRGLLLYSPVLVVAIACLVAGWRRSPDWARALLVGGVAYGVVQLRLNTFVGGFGYYGNRYWLEVLLCGAPVAYLGYVNWWAADSLRRRAARVLVALSVSIQALGALLAFSTAIAQVSVDPWRWYLPVEVLRDTGAAGMGVLFVVLALTLTLALRRVEEPATQSAVTL